jgi:acetoacetyl-CoA synthetase
MSERPILWAPSREQIERSRMAKFLRRHGCSDYDAGWRWSIDHRAEFWSALWDEVGVVGDKGTSILSDGDRMPGARWFPDARLNFAENLLKHRGERAALIAWDERGFRSRIGFDALRAEVAAAAAALRDAGVVAGDRVAAYLPNVPAAVVAMLASNAIGAIWSSCSVDFGVEAALDRIGQLRPRVLLSTDAALYAGKSIDLRERVRQIVGRLGTPLLHLHVAHLGADRVDAAQSWDEFLRPHRGAPERFERAAFDSPAFILFSSGTTGLPKCIVHGAGGTLLQHAKEHALHCDLGPADTLFYYTTTGWMMWNWLTSALFCGSTIVLYDGSPFHPEVDALWRMAERERISVLGTSAKYLASLEKRNVSPRRRDLTALRTILSTGSPLLPSSFDYVYREIRPDVQLASISGGTDIVSCFALGNPMLPVRREELQCRGLGMAVEVFDAQGRSLEAGVGELVCTRPFPSMPLGFFGDRDGRRFQSAYFARFTGVWHHGDFVERTPSGGMIFYGRSDATLNPGGVRIGTAEIYRIVEKLPEILECVAVGQPIEGDVAVVLFVRLAEGVELDAELEARIRWRLRQEASPHHVPRAIRAVPDIPRTVSGKISELAVLRAMEGKPVENEAALANPDALRWFRS